MEGFELSRQIAATAVDGLHGIEGIGHAQKLCGRRGQLTGAHGAGGGDAVDAAIRFDLDQGRQEPTRKSVLMLGPGDDVPERRVSVYEATRPMRSVLAQGRELVAQMKGRQRKDDGIAEEGHREVQQHDGGQSDNERDDPPRDTARSPRPLLLSPLAGHAHP